MSAKSILTSVFTRKQRSAIALRMTARVYEQIRDTVGAQPAETGGILGGSYDDGIIREFHFDATATTTSASYSPDADALNDLLRSWNPNDVRMLGFVHSHPRTLSRPSWADEEYATTVFRSNDDLATEFARLFLPIVHPQTNKQPFEIFPHVAVINRQGNMTLQRCDLEIVDEVLDLVTSESTVSSSAPKKPPRRAIQWPASPPEMLPLITFPANTAQLDETFARVKSAVDMARLATARIIVAGIGGAGSIVFNLARAGVGEFVLVDHDHVSHSNLATQRYRRSDVGRPKVECIAEAIREFNPLASVVACPWRIEEYDDADFGRLALEPFRTWKVSGRSYWGMLGNDVTIEARIRPSITLLVGTTDNFFAQAHVNRLALRFGLPSLCSQIYANGRAAEVTYTFPGITPACHRCMLESRYKAYFEEGFQNDVTPHGCPLSSITRINSLCEFVALALLHAGTGHSRWGSVIERLGNRNLLQVRMDPDADLDVFSRVFGARDQERIFSDETVWLPQIPNSGGDGRQPCPDCGGTGDLRHAQTSLERPPAPLNGAPL